MDFCFLCTARTPIISQGLDLMVFHVEDYFGKAFATTVMKFFIRDRATEKAGYAIRDRATDKAGSQPLL
jgi:hypothetical protein